MRQQRGGHGDYDKGDVSSVNAVSIGQKPSPAWGRGREEVERVRENLRPLLGSWVVMMVVGSMPMLSDAMGIISEQKNESLSLSLHRDG